MADAIPVSSEPTKRVAPKIKLPMFDGNGVPQPDDYVSTVRENLGEPALFQSSGANVREMTSEVTDKKGDPYVHSYTRQDN